MSTETDYQDLDETWEDEEDTVEEETTDDEPAVDDDEQDPELLIRDSSCAHKDKDARRRLDDLLDERRLRAQITDDF